MKVFLSSLVSPRNILKISDSLEFRDFFFKSGFERYSVNSDTLAI